MLGFTRESPQSCCTDFVLGVHVRLAYAASEPGLRLGLSSPSSVQDILLPLGARMICQQQLKDRLATLVSFSDSGEVLVKVDGGEAPFEQVAVLLSDGATFS